MAEKFECVRLVKCNGLDLNLFQFDYDLTFAAFFLNADKTVYARYGTRTSLDADKDVDIRGLAETMKAVLQLHRQYPSNRDVLAGKQPLKLEVNRPEDYSALQSYKPELDYNGPVSKGCIHCHQVRDSQRLEYRNAGKPMPLKLMFPYPRIGSVGFDLDPSTRSTVSKTIQDTSMYSGGPKVGDEIVMANGQVICSQADLAWVVHNLEPRQYLKFEVLRDGQPDRVNITISSNWRQSTDISWRPTSWDLRRMATGGLSFQVVGDVEKAKLNIHRQKMALRISHVGQYGQHARAKRAGFKKGDVVTSFDGQNDLMTESQVMEYAVQSKKPGDVVKIEFLRNGRKQSFPLRIQ